jgi:hypothetical protein
MRAVLAQGGAEGKRARRDYNSMACTQAEPFQQSPSVGHRQRATVWLLDGPQPQAPGGQQLLAKSPVLSQHSAVATVPPASRQACAAGLAVGVGVGSPPPHCRPSQHCSAGQLHTDTWWLDDGLQPQPPIEQLPGKSGWLSQQRLVETVPPAAAQTAANGLTVGIRVAVGTTVAVGVAAW